MELLVAATVGLTTAVGVYLILRRRTFPVILGMSMLSYAVNVFLFASGGLALDAPPLLAGKVPDGAPMTDPLPQALVLTAIVISFGMTAVVVMMALGGFFLSGDDRVDLVPGDEPRPGEADADRDAGDRGAGGDRA